MKSPTLTPWVVLKFGGTSVATRERWDAIAKSLGERQKEGLRPVLVCSAIAGVSNLLEALLEKAVRGEQESVLRTVRDKHEQLAESLGLDAGALLGGSFDDLDRFARGIFLVGEVSPRLHARVLARGELMSTRLGAAYLSARGMPATWVDVREHLEAVPEPGATQVRNLLSATCPYDADPVMQQAFAALPGVIVTQGFIARGEDGATVLLGRGGSDTSASTMAARLQAKRCEIWTDVPGMFTANPRQIPAARLLRALDYDEAQEVVSTGAKVLHPRSIHPARASGIPLHVLCTERPELEGTVVSRTGAGDRAQVKAISMKTGVMLVSMDTPGMWQQVGFLADIFACFKHHGLSIDMVSTSEMNVTVTLDAGSNPIDTAVLEALCKDLNHHCRTRVVGPCASISLVGRHIRAILHKLGPALEVFEEQRIHLVSQAASDLNLSFVVEVSQAERLLRKLHALIFPQRKQDPVLGPSWQEMFEGDPRIDEGSRLTPWWETRRDDLLHRARQCTPSYVLDSGSLDSAAEEMLGLEAVSRVLYAVKANPHSDVLRRFEARGLCFECVSPGEVSHVQATLPSLSPERILFTPNFAPRREYLEALERGVHVTLDSTYPLQAWPEAFRGRELFLRIDPGRGRGHHDHVQTAGETSKFGIPLSELKEVVGLVKELGIKVVGLHAHLGSGIRTEQDWANTALLLARVAEEFPGVKVLDLGGGLGVPERVGQVGLDLDRVGSSLGEVKRAHPEWELWVEPGRYLVARAGVLLVKVTQIKRKGDVWYVGVDAGMNTLIRPALYGAYHEIVNLTRLGEPASMVANVVGPICETGDTLGYNRNLPETREGDILLVSTVGAYGRSMSSRYNLREPAEEVVI